MATINGTDSDNILTGGTGDDLLSGMGGNDVLNGGTGKDTMNGGSGNDTYYVDNAGDTIIETNLLATEIDRIISSISWSLSSAGNENIENLTLTGSAIEGSGNALGNVIYGNTIANKLYGMDGDDTLYGQDGNDELAGGAGNDQLIGGNGNDTLIGAYDGSASDESDTLTGGTGNDIYVVDSAADVVVESSSLATEIDEVWSSTSWTLGSNLETLLLTGTLSTFGVGNSLDNFIYGNSAKNNLFGAGGADELRGGAGNDVLNGGDGNDKLYGEEGNDQLDGGLGIDRMTGGSGNDIYILDRQDDLAIEEGVSTSEIDGIIIKGNFHWTLGVNFENLTLHGTASINGTGNERNNVITGNAGNNQLFGGLGNDTLNGGRGVDTLEGGAGNDIYVVDNIGDQLKEYSTLSTEIDTVQSSINWSLNKAGLENIENLTLTFDAIEATGNGKANRITGNTSENTLRGLTGNDTYVVQNLNDQIVEEGTSLAEIDTVESSVTWTLGDRLENLTLTGYSAIWGYGNALTNTMNGNAGNNYLSGLSGADILYGGGGDDTLNGGSGVDRMYGGSGNDTYVLDTLSDIVSETGTSKYEIDTVRIALTYTLGANIENLTLTGQSTVNGFGNELDNTLIGNSAANELHGLAGNDTYVVYSTDDSLIEAAAGGTDTVESWLDWTLGDHLENLTLLGSEMLEGRGNELANVITGNDANNALYGLGGDDRLIGGGGIDIMDGGSGNDTYVVDDLDYMVIELNNSSLEIDTIESSISWTLSEANIENLTLTGYAAINGTGNALANTILGNQAANILSGLGGNDILQGLAGNDTLNGGGGSDTLGGDTGNDVLNGGDGNDFMEGVLGDDRLDGNKGLDTMNGGAGADTYVVDNGGDVVTETIVSTLPAERDTVESWITYTLTGNVENLTLKGTLNINGTGNELNNTIIGNALNNSLSGHSGADLLQGGLGSDRLTGGDGKDTLIGGSGNDIFDFNALSETGLSSSTWDIISDFTRGQDKIDLSTLDANTATTTSNEAFTSVIGSTSAFTAAGQLKVVSGVLYGNTDADSTAEFAIQLTGISALSTTDFIL